MWKSTKQSNDVMEPRCPALSENGTQPDANDWGRELSSCTHASHTEAGWNKRPASWFQRVDGRCWLKRIPQPRTGIGPQEHNVWPTYRNHTTAEHQHTLWSGISATLCPRLITLFIIWTAWLFNLTLKLQCIRFGSKCKNLFSSMKASSVNCILRLGQYTSWEVLLSGPLRSSDLVQAASLWRTRCLK